MASWTSLGHGMRRRAGLPTNTLESAGKSMARNHATHHEAYEAAAEVGSPRIPMGATPAPQGTLVPRKNTQAGDPTAGGKANRQNIERVGATYRVTVPFTPTIDPAAGPTMASAHVVPSAVSRSNNFYSEQQISGQ